MSYLTVWRDLMQLPIFTSHSYNGEMDIHYSKQFNSYHVRPVFVYCSINFYINSLLA
jgi:hypothetical protein